MSDAIEIKINKLAQVMKAFKKMPVIKIGILGDRNTRSGKGTATNSLIGAVHEFGNSTHPMRSFLRIPLNDHLGDALEDSGAFNRETLDDVIRDGNAIPWMKKVAVIAEKVVQEAFGSGGFGKWPQWAPGYENNTGQILVDTQQLRNSITSEVK